VDFRLLELFARGARGGGASDGAFLARLLAPEAATPDRLNYLPAWLLAQALQAIGALAPAAAQTAQALQVY
jgi:hypothetical protein